MFLNKLAMNSKISRATSEQRPVVMELMNIRDRAEGNKEVMSACLALTDFVMKEGYALLEAPVASYKIVEKFCNDSDIEFSPDLASALNPLKRLYLDTKKAERKAKQLVAEQELAAWGIDLNEKFRGSIDLQEWGRRTVENPLGDIAVSFRGDDFEKILEDVKKFPSARFLRKFWLVPGKYWGHAEIWRKKKCR